MIFVNFKTYQEGTGEKAIELVGICNQVQKKTKIKIIPVVQVVDLYHAHHHFPKFKLWTQHVDSISFGSHTGQILPEGVVAAGAQGTLLNHSESKLPLEVIKETIRRCQGLGLKVLACSDSFEEAKEIMETKPDLIAYEPPEFIGSRTTSVATAKPEIIKDLVKKIKKVPVLVGAGIHSQADVRLAIKLGAAGVLVATDVVLAKDPEKELLDLAKGFK